MIALPIHLPPGFSPVVSVHDTVTVGQTLAEFTAKEEEIVNIPQELGVSLKKAKQILKKNPGDRVEEGEVIAVKKKFFGFEEEELVSKVNGLVSRYERDTGNLVIATSYKALTKKLVSPVDGLVAICDNDRIVVNTDKDVLTATKAIGGRSQGELFVLESSFTEGDTSTSTLYHLDSRAIGKIVLGGKLTREVLMKGIGIGAKGLIGTHISDEDLEYIHGRGVKVPIIKIESETIQVLRRWENKRVYVDSTSKTILFLHI